MTSLPRLKCWRLLSGGLLAAASALIPGRLNAADEAGKIWGRWHYVKERSDSIGTAADTAAKDLPLIVRSIARAQLFAALKPYQWVHLGHTGDQIQIATSDWPVILTDSSGSKFPWKRPDGKRQQVSTSLAGDVLRQTFASSQGTYTNEYSLESGGFLAVRVTVTSPLMKAPVSYVLRYRQQPG